MNDATILNQPHIYPELKAKCEEIGFTMSSDIFTGTLLRTLVASKPKSNLLELGTGPGLSLAWMIDGLDEESQIITIDKDPELIKIAQNYFGNDARVDIVCADGAEWLRNYKGPRFDLIFADAWPGKYSELEEALQLVRRGGFYIIDDMSEQPNWPEGHAEKVVELIGYLETRDDFVITKINWSTGVVICTRRA